MGKKLQCTSKTIQSNILERSKSQEQLLPLELSTEEGKMTDPFEDSEDKDQENDMQSKFQHLMNVASYLNRSADSRNMMRIIDMEKSSKIYDIEKCDQNRFKSKEKYGAH